MPYASTADIEFAAGGPERMRQLFDWAKTGAVDASVVARAQEHADSMIDGYARLRFSVPILNPSATLRAFAAQLAVHYVRRIRGVITDSEAAEIEKQQLLWLERLSAGRVVLSEPEANPTKNVSVAIFHNAGPFARCNTEGLF